MSEDDIFEKEKMKEEQAENPQVQGEEGQTENSQTQEEETEVAEACGEDDLNEEKEDLRSEFERELENYLPTEENTNKIKKEFKMPAWGIAVVSAVASCILCAVVYTFLVTPHLRPEAVISYVNSGNGEKVEELTGIRAIVQNISPSIVTVTGEASYQSFFGLSSQSSTGSGVIISQDGYILTSNSIVGDGSNVTVTLADKNDYKAEIVGQDTMKDIAILKIAAEGLSPAVLGDSNDVYPGDISMVMGNVLGPTLGVSVTRGIICGVNKGVSMSNGGSINLLQTDAATNSNNAGGCLLNASGEVVGMITYAVSSNTDKISLAIPSNDIKNITESLINTGIAPSGLMIGITGSDTDHGVVVESVVDDSPAKKAGIKEGDLILKVDQNAVKSISDINAIRDSHKKGDIIVLTIYREGDIIDIEVKL